MQTYLVDISANIDDGNLGVVSYPRTQLSDLDAYQALAPAMHQAAAQMPGVDQMHPAHHLHVSPFGFAQSPMNGFISDFQANNQHVQSQMNFTDFYFMNTQMNGHEAPHLNPLFARQNSNSQQDESTDEERAAIREYIEGNPKGQGLDYLNEDDEYEARLDGARDARVGRPDGERYHNNIAMFGPPLKFGWDFFTEDIRTIIDPQASMDDKALAAGFLLFKPAKIGDKALDLSRARKAPSTNLNYDDRVLGRMREDPGTHHNFPSSFDRDILGSPPALTRADGRMEHLNKGMINGKEGVYTLL